MVELALQGSLNLQQLVNVDGLVKRKRGEQFGPSLMDTTASRAVLGGLPPMCIDVSGVGKFPNLSVATATAVLG